MGKLLVFVLLLSPILAQEEKPTEPAECNDLNKGICQCGNPKNGFTTYTFWLGDEEPEQRCFTVYIPPMLKNETLPVAVLAQCYAKNKLQRLGMIHGHHDANVAARRYGYARIGISNERGSWSIPNTQVVNDENPLPCRVSIFEYDFLVPVLIF